MKGDYLLFMHRIERNFWAPSVTCTAIGFDGVTILMQSLTIVAISGHSIRNKLYGI